MGPDGQSRPGTPEADAASDDAALVEAARGAPAAFYQFRLSPGGAYSIPFVSPAFVRRYEFAPGEPEETARRFFTRIHPDDVARIGDAIARSARTLEPFDGEFRFRLPSGGEVWAEARSNPERTADGGTLWNGVVTDISARKNAETSVARLNAELKDALEWQRQIFEGSRDAVFLSDEKGRFVAVNLAAERLTGYSRAELLAMAIPGLHDDPDLEAYRTYHRRILNGEEILSEAPIRRKDGTKIPVEFNNTLVVIGERRLVHTVGRDVTSRLRLEEQLRQAQKMEAVGQLAGGIAHDFNNLATVISGNTDLLLGETPEGDARRGPLTDIRSAGERAASLTRQLLAFSRKQILEPRLVDVHEVVAGVEKMLRRLIGEDVDLVTDFAADPSSVKVDPGQLEQVVVNLVVNARDAMSRGGRITIRTRTLEPGEAADPAEPSGLRLRPKVAISIADTGTGLSPEARAHLFEPFFTTKEVGKGTGLGLATAYGIVKQSGGDISVESVPGRGATFTVVLPSHVPARRGSSGTSLRALPRGAETVLVVEDEDAVRRIVKRALEATGYRVLEARNGSEALEAVREHAGGIHIVVTDVVMPEMSGRELAERIERDHPGVRILYMSGYTDDAVMRHGIVESGVAFLQKPFSPAALARKVREVLDGQGSRIQG